MQGPKELFELIMKRGNVTEAQANEWVHYLGQLNGCRLYSVAAQELDPQGWLMARTHGIGGSDIATILGENPWSSPKKIWLSKMDMFDSEKQPRQSESARWGNLLETTIATEWGVRHERKWIHIPVTLQSEQYPWMLANIDGFVLSDDRRKITGILEIKTTSAYNEEPWSDGPLPFYYLCQVNWYCGICGLDMFCITCLVGGQKLYAYNDMPADPDLYKREVEAAANFWQNNVLKGIEPAPTDGDYADLAAEEHDESVPPVILNDEESNNVVNSYCELRSQISQLEKVKKSLGAVLYDYLGKATDGVIGDHTVHISYSKRRSVDYKVLKDQFPDAYDAAVSIKPTPQLNVK